MSDATVHHGDSRDVIRTLPDCSVDSVVTDPPYALVSIQKRYGAANAKASADVYGRATAGFMGKQWDTGDTAFAVEFWREVFRVLKPGGHVIAFGGTRTYHRLAVAIEDAGFEIRDQIGWLYGSGFPKSHDVSKGIDKMKGGIRAKVRIPADFVRNPKATGAGRDGTEGATRPWIEEALARGYHEKDGDEPATPEARAWQGWGTALKPAWEPIVLARKPLIGTVAENVLQHGTGALNIDGCRVPIDGETFRAPQSDPSKRAGTVGTDLGITRAGTGKFQAAQRASIERTATLGRWPANVIHDGSDEVVAAFPETHSGTFNGNRSADKFRNTFGTFKGTPEGEGQYFANEGSAARFFYSAKADAHDRLGSKHPTVKPVDLMRYLCRLVTPPGGLVLDPFAGSGSTGVACIAEGFRAILIEREEEYVADIRRRIAWAQGEGGLTDGEKLARVPDEKKRGDDLPLFA